MNCHKKSGKGSKFNFTTLRLLHYPAVNTETLLPGQVRCGEHVDYGSITLLFQDRSGGLQVGVVFSCIYPRSVLVVADLSKDCLIIMMKGLVLLCAHHPTNICVLEEHAWLL